MSEYPSVATLVLTYNDVELTRDCLRSVLQADYPTGQHRVYLIDNYSQEVNTEILINEFPQVCYIRTLRNLGYAGGVNAGIRHAIHDGASYVYVLNNDAVAEKGYLSSAIDVLERDKTIGVCGSLMMSYENRSMIQDAGYRIAPNQALPIPIGRGELDQGQFDTVQEVDSVSGGGVCLRVSTLLSIGLFDPSFFCYWEDTDLCFRVRAYGQRVVSTGKSKIFHLGSMTAGIGSPLYMYYFTRNSFWVAKRHGLRRSFPVAKVIQVPRVIMWLLFRVRQHRSVLPYLRGLVDGLRIPPISSKELLQFSFSREYMPVGPYIGS